MFEFLPADTALNHRECDENEARQLLRNHVRDVGHAMNRMRDNPFGQTTCEGGTLRYVPTT